MSTVWFSLSILSIFVARCISFQRLVNYLAFNHQLTNVNRKARGVHFMGDLRFYSFRYMFFQICFIDFVGFVAVVKSIFRSVCSPRKKDIYIYLK
jgi:hypothetical protein